MATLVPWPHSSHTRRSLSCSVPCLLYFVRPAREEGTGNVPPVFLFVLSLFLDLFSDPFFLQKGDNVKQNISDVAPLLRGGIKSEPSKEEQQMGWLVFPLFAWGSIPE